MPEAVYVLDTFTASQQGQLTVEKNQELVLLNHEHYYWWYVQERESSSMGFVPAELVEFPNERLARQNSLRNQTLQVGVEIPRPRAKRKCSVRFTPFLSDCPDLSADLSSSENEMPMSAEITVENPITAIGEDQKSFACTYDAVPGMAANLERMTDLERRLRLLIDSAAI